MVQQEFDSTGKPLSMKPAAIANRARRKRVREEKAGTGKVIDQSGQEHADPNAPAAPDTGTIGVQTPEKPTVPIENDTQAYHCSNCDEDIKRSWPKCQACGADLNWPVGL